MCEVMSVDVKLVCISNNLVSFLPLPLQNEVTALDIARVHTHQEICELLTQQMAKSTTPTQQPERPLQVLWPHIVLILSDTHSTHCDSCSCEHTFDQDCGSFLI